MIDIWLIKIYINIFHKYFSDEHKKRAFFDAFEPLSSGVAREAIALFNQWWLDIRSNTYITSVSEHDETEEEQDREEEAEEEELEENAAPVVPRPQNTRTIEVERFVPAGQVDLRYLEKPY